MSRETSVNNDTCSVFAFNFAFMQISLDVLFEMDLSPNIARCFHRTRKELRSFTLKAAITDSVVYIVNFYVNTCIF